MTTISPPEKLSDRILKSLFIYTLYIQNVYNLKAENGWTTIESYSDINIETAINNAYRNLKDNNIKSALIDSELLMAKVFNKSF